MSETQGRALRPVASLPWSDRGGDPRLRIRDMVSQLDLGWQVDAACIDVGTETFFPGKGEPSGPAKSVCAGCPVRTPCLEYAIRLESSAPTAAHGIWGGHSPSERQHIIRERRQAA